MHNLQRKTLAVIGAGPKGLAIGVKAKVLEEFGFNVDRVILIEKHSVGANWSGDSGYTNGEMKLGTSPEKDVVFPIETDVGDTTLNHRIRERLLNFTWTSFLVQTQNFSDWVDRGRPAPSHALWSEYLKWVSEQLAPQVLILKAEVTSVDIDENAKNWVLSLKADDSMQSLTVDGLMITGPGKTKMDFVEQDSGQLPLGVYDLESFWEALKSGSFTAKGRVAIVGTGENAASILLTLGNQFPNLRVDVISKKGFISTRSENYYENQIYSQPDRNNWRDLELSDRRDFIKRTDLGVFSGDAMQILNSQLRHNIVAGDLLGLKFISDELALTLEYRKKLSVRHYDQVILATGFDQISMLKFLLSKKALCFINESLQVPLDHFEITSRIQEDLSVEKITPSLYLPALAGLMQGPGFANLSCLGRLSDRVILTSNEKEIL